MVKRILENELYTGTFISRKGERNKINIIYRAVPESEQFRHDNFLPAIVAKDILEQADFLNDRRQKGNIRDRDNAERYGRMIEKRQAETTPFTCGSWNCKICRIPFAKSKRPSKRTSP